MQELTESLRQDSVKSVTEEPKMKIPYFNLAKQSPKFASANDDSSQQVSSKSLSVELLPDTNLLQHIVNMRVKKGAGPEILKMAGKR